MNFDWQLDEPYNSVRHRSSIVVMVLPEEYYCVAEVMSNEEPGDHQETAFVKIEDRLDTILAKTESFASTRKSP